MEKQGRQKCSGEGRGGWWLTQEAYFGGVAAPSEIGEGNVHEKGYDVAKQKQICPIPPPHTVALVVLVPHAAPTAEIPPALGIGTAVESRGNPLVGTAETRMSPKQTLKGSDDGDELQGGQQSSRPRGFAIWDTIIPQQQHTREGELSPPKTHLGPTVEKRAAPTGHGAKNIGDQNLGHP